MESKKPKYTKLKVDDFSSTIFCKYYNYFMETVLPELTEEQKSNMKYILVPKIHGQDTVQKIY